MTVIAGGMATGRLGAGAALRVYIWTHRHQTELTGNGMGFW